MYAATKIQNKIKVPKILGLPKEIQLYSSDQLKVIIIMTYNNKLM